MFIDKAKIQVKAGDGGNGYVSFYRAKYITNGGPDGGDGGRGGNIIFVADSSLTTLKDFKYKRKYIADNGGDGARMNCSGKASENLVIKVPVGTIIREATTNKIMADLVTDKQEIVLIKGGRGGRGNQHFATSTLQAPKYAEQGKKAKGYDIVLELKTIADVGIIGFPNVGKSTLLKMLTNAKPKIDNYHFTTLSPNLGVIQNKWGDDFVLADIPGLIEGASDGLGLGHEFLRHIERTKVLIHVVDASGCEGDDPLNNLNIINNELLKYNEELLKRPQIIACNKMDLPDADENYQKIKLAFDVPVIPISAASNQGLDLLIQTVSKVLQEHKDDIIFIPDYEEFVDTSVEDGKFHIVRENNKFIVTGKSLEKMLSLTDLDTEKGFRFFQKYLREKGIIAKLEEMGVNDSDTVSLYDVEFDYYK